MPSPIYAKALDAVCTFIPKEKAAGILDRQLPKCGATQDDLSRGGLDQIMTYLVGAAGLYIPDASRRKDLEAKLQAIR